MSLVRPPPPLYLRIIAPGLIPVHVLSATDEHAEEAKENIEKQVSTARDQITHHAVDLGSLSDVQKVITPLKGLERIDMLYLIAGIGVAPFGLTKDGLGNHFAVNHLAHFLLVDGLLPKLRETAKSTSGDFTTRIVAESSELHRAAPSDTAFASVDEMNQEIDPTKLYGRAKLMK